ncbi:helix-turn-helix transcriptional regulator [Spirosoma sp. KCTC 42546]|uniref:response regulator transcription factor n=1 Tax=Spirosoma sp. KCTC 42546 TaxID=2520506 RepID=UPI001157B6B4|nr:helix-turn-helix transcriptional regulator [Spirosoma sp. KCTC 42546]QDK82488.1 helix-turn-helix transcriptional regulator [Spirosoma sp. KCTC 42546]
MERPHFTPNRNEAPPKIALPNQALFELTPREWQVLLYVVEDLTNAEIADLLYLSTKSVVNYRNRIGSKLNLQGARKLAQFARKHQHELQKLYEVLVVKSPFCEYKQ